MWYVVISAEIKVVWDLYILVNLVDFFFFLTLLAEVLGFGNTVVSLRSCCLIFQTKPRGIWGQWKRG